MLPTAAESNNNTSGNGQFGSLTRRRRNKKQGENFVTSANLEDYTFIGKNDRRMRFNNSKDPIYYVFDVIENRPVHKLAKEFVKDIFKDTCNFVSGIVVG